MEWVETTGRTVAAALDAATDQLGVDENEVEYQVIQEAKAGLFGKVGGKPARIRARVKPISREKPGDRQRSGRGRQPRRNDRKRSGASLPASSAGGSKPQEESTPVAAGPDTARESGEAGATKSNRSRRGGGRGRGAGASGKDSGTVPQKGNDVSIEEIPIGEQADAADEFMRGLLDAVGLPAEVAVRIEEDTVLVDVEGADLGVLVGPKGATLRAIEDLVRTIVQRRTDGHGARIHVDVGGYQAKRRAALEQFTQGLTERVLSSGAEVALEPMPAADRKIVHDTVGEIDGVTTVSEGEEPRRRVVIRPS